MARRKREPMSEGKKNIIGMLLFGINGMWAGFAVAPLLTLICVYGYVYLRFGRENFPFLLKDIDSDIEVMDDILTPETAAALSDRVGESVRERGLSPMPRSLLKRSSLLFENGVSKRDNHIF